jgi:hypothetical protein
MKYLSLIILTFFFSCSQGDKSQQLQDSVKVKAALKPETCEYFLLKSKVNTEISNADTEDILRLLFPTSRIADKKSYWSCDSTRFNKIFEYGYEKNEYQTLIVLIDTFYMSTGARIIFTCKTQPVNYNCHPCAPVIHAGILDRMKDNKWRLTEIDSLGIFGSFAEASPMETIQLGSQGEIGIICRPGFTNFGVTEQALDLFVYTNKFHHSLHLDNVMGSNEGATHNAKKKWAFDTKLEIVQDSTEGLSSIRITKQGTYQDEQNEISNIIEENVYFYRNGEYVNY